MVANIILKEYLKTLGTKEGIEMVSKLIAKKYWNLDLDIPVIINPQLTSSYGRHMYKYIRNENKKVIGKEPLRIEISGKAFRNFTKYAMLDLLKHEVCHWACMKLASSHSDGSKFFEKEIKRINATPTGKDMMEKGYREKLNKKQKGI